MKENVKAICCDIDGTLLRDDKSLSEENIYWIKKAVKEKEISFTLVSGRMYNGVKPFYEPLGVTGPVSCYNGGTLYDSDGNVITEHRMSHEIALKLLDIYHKTGVGLILFNDKNWYLEKLDDFMYPNKKKMYLSECVVGNFDELLEQFDTNKVLFMSPRQEDLNRVDKLVKEAGLYGTYLTGYRIKPCLELIPCNVNKGLAIDALADYFKIPHANIMALGDDANDIEMLTKAGISVAMQNAVPQAKETARYITDTNNNDGVAKAIKRFVFGM